MRFDSKYPTAMALVNPSPSSKDVEIQTGIVSKLCPAINQQARKEPIKVIAKSGGRRRNAISAMSVMATIKLMSRKDENLVREMSDAATASSNVAKLNRLGPSSA